MNYFVRDKGCNFEIIIWNKTNVPPFTSGHYLKDKEYCLLFWEKGVKIKGTFETAKTVYVDKVNITDKKLYDHPCIKPLNIIRNFILNSTEEGDLVLDSFMGSCGVGVACKELNRDFIGFEIDKRYYDIAVDRVNGITQKERKAGLKQDKLFEL